MEQTINTYSFKELYDRFDSMDGEEIMDEYHKVFHSLHDLLDKEYKELSTEEWGVIEQLDKANDFLGHYLAQSFCTHCGYTFQRGD